MSIEALAAKRDVSRRYPADPPKVEEIVVVMRRAGVGIHGARSRALITILWRAGLRISEALDLAEQDLWDHPTALRHLLERARPIAKLPHQ